MKCPFCAEEIQSDAKKCRFCGEWLAQKPVIDASTQARAVAKGIKKQKQDEAASGAIGCLGAFAGLVLGFSIGGVGGFWIGLIVFGFIAGVGAYHYNKE